MVSVLPYEMGLTMGLEWSSLRFTLPTLSGNLAHYESRPVILMAIIGNFAPVNLAFAWTKAENVPLILGQVNFFQEFDVCFFRSRLAFAVQPQGMGDLELTLE